MTVLPKTLKQRLREERGFTLLELLISLALLGLIMVYLSTSFSFGKRAWQTTGKINELAVIEPVRSFLARRLAQAMPVSLSGSNGQRMRLAFKGSKNSVLFAATSKGNTEIAGVYIYTVSIKNDASKLASKAALHVTQSLFQRKNWANQPDRSEQKRMLVDGIEGARFRYFGAQTKSAQPSWQESWSSSSRLPQLVRIELNFAEDDKRVWNEFVVELKLSY